MSGNLPTSAVDTSASDSALLLGSPQPVPSLTDTDAPAVVRVDPSIATRIDAIVSDYVKGLASLDPNSPDFAAKVRAIHAMASDDIRQSASVSNRLLDKPIKAMESGLFSQSTAVSKSLVELRRTVEDLDPSAHELLNPKRLLGLVPLGKRLRDYFGRYQSAQGHLNAIVQALYRGQDELRQDNAAIEQEKVNIWSIKGSLEQYIYMAGKLDATLEAEIDQIGQTDPGRAKLLREDLLFYIRQKRQDLLTQLAVNAQGYLALELVRKSNLELIKGVDRATTTTVSALRTAVMVAQALVNQKLVLNQIAALTTTTGHLIESTSGMLRDQTGQVHDLGADAIVGIEKLQAAFANVYAALDTIDAYKLEALDSMRKTVVALTSEVTRAQSYLERARNAPATKRIGSGGPADLSLEGPAAPSK